MLKEGGNHKVEVDEDHPRNHWDVDVHIESL